MSLARRIATSVLGGPMAKILADCRIRLREEWRLSRHHRWGVAAAKRFLDQRSLKLHLGCGNVYKPGWINIDSYHLPPCTPDLTLDLRRPLPFADASCAEIYSEHFFEHVHYPDAANEMLREWRRVLAPGGKVSLGVPDPIPVLTAYLNDAPEPYFDYFSNHFSVQRYLGTKMEAVNWLFKQGGEHQFIYDYPSLEKMLRDAGFHRIARRDFDAARDSEPRRHGTLYVDAVKPAELA